MIMRNKTFELAEEWELDIIEITQGMNGYPDGLYKAVKGFESFKDAEAFTDEIFGEVVLITKKDGWQFWINEGKMWSGIPRDKFFDESKYEMFTNENDFEDWCCDAIESEMMGGFNLCDLRDIVCTMNDTYDEIWRMRDVEMALVDKSDYTCEIVDREVAEIHDGDVTTLAIAVIEKELEDIEEDDE